MNEKEKIELEELLSGCLDGQLSERQHTELRRLMEHQTQLKEQLRLLEKQRELLRQLPVERAPVGLADEIKASLQRRLLLASSERFAVETGHRKLLAIRRMVSAAALVLVPLALLAVVVITIIQPFGSEPSGREDLISGRVAPKVTEPGGAGTNEPRGVGVLSEPSLEARLVLSTAQPIATNDYIEKRIYSSGLLGYTVSKREAGVTIYTIVCSVKNIGGFVSELEGLLPHCDISALTVSVKDGQSNKIESVSAGQIKPLLETADPQQRDELARSFAQQNKSKALVKEPDKAEKDIPEPPAGQSKPILAWDEGQADTNEPQDQPVRFVLEVRGR